MAIAIRFKIRPAIAVPLLVPLEKRPKKDKKNPMIPRKLPITMHDRTTDMIPTTIPATPSALWGLGCIVLFLFSSLVVCDTGKHVSTIELYNKVYCIANKKGEKYAMV